MRGYLHHGLLTIGNGSGPLPPEPSHYYYILQNFVDGHEIGTPILSGDDHGEDWIRTVLSSIDLSDEWLCDDQSHLVDSTVGADLIDDRAPLDFSKYNISSGTPYGMCTSNYDDTTCMVSFDVSLRRSYPITVETFASARTMTAYYDSYGNERVFSLGSLGSARVPKYNLSLEINSTTNEITLVMNGGLNNSATSGGPYTLLTVDCSTDPDFANPSATSYDTELGLWLPGWHHYAITIDEEKIYLFIDGHLKGTVDLETYISFNVIVFNGSSFVTKTLSGTLRSMLNDMETFVSVKAYNMNQESFDARYANFAVTDVCKWTSDFDIPTVPYDDKTPPEDLPQRTIRFEFSNPALDPRTPNGTTWRSITYYSSKADNATWTKVQGVSTNQWDCFYDDADWSGMFQYVNNYGNLDSDMKIIDSNLTGVTNIAKLFYENYALVGDASLKNLDSITEIDNIFYETRNVETIELDDLPLLTNVQMIAEGNNELLSVKIGNMDGLTSGSNMFMDCKKLESIEIGNMNSLISWGTAPIYAYDQNLPKVKTLKIGNLPKATSLTNNAGTYGILHGRLSNYSESGLNGSIETFIIGNTEKLTHTKGLFSSCSTLKYVSPMNLESVTDTTEMFFDCGSMTSAPDLRIGSNWRIAEGMFIDCTSLTTVPAYNTAVLNITTRMFLRCRALTHIPLTDFSMATDTHQMFNGCSGLLEIADLTLGAGRITDDSEMFRDCVNVATGITRVYDKLVAAQGSTYYHWGTFMNCGTNSTTGSAELANIPSSWK